MDKDLPVTVVDAAEYIISGITKSRILPDSQLIYCREGSGEIFSEDALPMRFSKGDVIYLSSSIMHRFSLDSASLTLISFTGQYELYMADFFHFDSACVIKSCTECEKQFREIAAHKQNDSYNEISLSVSLYELIVNLGIKVLEEREKAATEDGYIMRKIINYIIENYSKNTFSVDSALREANLDRIQVEKVFRENLGMSIDEYFLFFRLENLRNVLFLRPHLNPRRCAVTNGFASYEEFEQAFIAAYGLSPEEFLHEINPPT